MKVLLAGATKTRNYTRGEVKSDPGKSERSVYESSTITMLITMFPVSFYPGSNIAVDTLDASPHKQ